MNPGTTIIGAALAALALTQAAWAQPQADQATLERGQAPIWNRSSTES